MASISEWQKFYGTGNYADQSRRIGTAVEEAIGQNRVKVDRMRANEDRARKMEMEDFAMAQLKRKEYQGLQIPADGEYEDIDARYQQAARQIPDAWAEIVSKGPNGTGEFSAEQVAMGQANLTKQVGDLKAMKAGVTAQRDSTMQMLQNGEVSSYNTVEEVDYATTLLVPNNGLKIESDGTNMYLRGKTAGNGDDINIALSRYSQSPQLTRKAADPRGSLNAINKAAYAREQGTSVNNPDLIDAWKDSYANMTDQLGDKGSKGLAMDWLGFSREEVELFSNGDTNNIEGGYKPEGSENTYSSELDYLMEKKYIEMGEATFMENEMQQQKLRNSKALYATRQQQLKNAQMSADPQKVDDLIGRQERATAYESTIESLADFGFGQNDAGVFTGNFDLFDEDGTTVSEKVQRGLSKIGFEIAEIGTEATYDKNTNQEITPANNEEIMIKPIGGKNTDGVTIRPGENAQLVLQKIFQAKGFSQTQAKQLATQSRRGTGDLMNYNKAIYNSLIAAPGQGISSGTKYGYSN